MEKQVNATHGIVCSMPDQAHGYFGWPSIARMDDGTLVAVSSGFRAHHICPWGKTVLHISRDQGISWSQPVILNNSPIDDRDAGVISLGAETLLVSWFTADNRTYMDWMKSNLSALEYNLALDRMQGWSDETIRTFKGSWIRTGKLGGQWSEPVRVPVTSPHGPILLKNGDLLYIGKAYGCDDQDANEGSMKAARSRDGGKSWQMTGTIPLAAGTVYDNFHELHAVELPSGKILGLIRYEHSKGAQAYLNFSIFQTESLDGGVTWTVPKPTGVFGSPPHIIRHSSGALVCVYGYRREPYGQRAMISFDEGESWEADYVLRADGPTGDLGYPASVEMPDGSLFTVYYQSTGENYKTSILWTRWNPFR